MQWISFATASVNITIAAMFFGGWAMTRHRALLNFAGGYALYTVAFGSFAFQYIDPMILHFGNVAVILGTVILYCGLAKRSGWQLNAVACAVVASVGIGGEIAGALLGNEQLRLTIIYGVLGLLTFMGAQAGHRANLKDKLERGVVWTLYTISVLLLTHPKFLNSLIPSLLPSAIVQASWAFYSIVWIICSQVLAGSLIALAVRDVIQKAQHEAVVDPLSGLMNRRGFTAALKRDHRQGDRAALVMVDVDYFKDINDQLGHDVGDQTIQLLSAIVAKAAPRGSCAARLGGEEFCVLLNDGGLEAAKLVASDIQAAVNSTERALDFTISIGIGCGPHDLLYRRADKALYLAKTTGRDRTCVWEETPASDRHAARLVDAALAQG
ncbi:MAG: GGDEF domain-containing protein [Pseudomonadota bacterium]